MGSESTAKTDNEKFKVGLAPWYLDIVYLSQLYGISKNQILNLNQGTDFLKLSGTFPLTLNKDIDGNDVMQVIMSDYDIPDYDTLAKKKQTYTMFTKKPRNIDYTNKGYIDARIKEIRAGIPKSKSVVVEPKINSPRQSFSKPDYILGNRMSTTFVKSK